MHRPDPYCANVLQTNCLLSVLAQAPLCACDGRQKFSSKALLSTKKLDKAMAEPATMGERNPLGCPHY